MKIYDINNSPIIPGIGTDKFKIGMPIDMDRFIAMLSECCQVERKYTTNYWNIQTNNVWFHVDEETNTLKSMLFLNGYAGKINNIIGIGSPEWMLDPVGADGFAYSKKFLGLSFNTKRVGNNDVIAWIQVFSPDKVLDDE
jgi:hypothetical protein